MTYVHLASAPRFFFSEEYLLRLKRINIHDINKVNIFPKVITVFVPNGHSIPACDCPKIEFILPGKIQFAQNKAKVISPLSPEEIVAAKIRSMNPHLLHAANLHLGGNDLK